MLTFFVTEKRWKWLFGKVIEVTARNNAAYHTLMRLWAKGKDWNGKAMSGKKLLFLDWLYACVCVCVCVCVYIYIYMCVCVCVCLYIYIYICMYVYQRRNIWSWQESHKCMKGVVHNTKQPSHLLQLDSYFNIPNLCNMTNCVMFPTHMGQMKIKVMIWVKESCGLAIQLTSVIRRSRMW